MKNSLWFVTYNGMGGHPVLSFAPDLLLPADTNSLGDAISEIEFCAHVKSMHGPRPESDFLMARFVDRLAILPKAWFRRKQKRLEIAYHSRVGCAEDLLGGDFAAKKVVDVTQLRRTCEEVAESLALLKTCVKRSDNFDVGRFLSFVETKNAELTTLDDSQVLLYLTEAQAAEHKRVESRK